MNNFSSLKSVCLPLAFVFLALTGCSPAITLKIAPPESRDSATFEASLSPTAENLVRRMTDTGKTGATGDTTTAGSPGSLYDREAILGSIGKAGLRADTLEFPGKTGIRLGLTLLKADGFLGNALSVSKDSKKMTVTLSRETLAHAVDLMPSETRDYLDLFMAPAFTGEALTVPEYRDIIAATYGKTLAGELASSTFTLTVLCPSSPKQASITAPGTVTRTSNSAVFRVPLATILVLDTPIVAEMSW